jgi:hypothetical protein
VAARARTAPTRRGLTLRGHTQTLAQARAARSGVDQERHPVRSGATYFAGPRSHTAKQNQEP